MRVGGAEGAEDGFGIVGVLVVRQVGDVHDELARHCAEQLGDDVRQDLVPREHAVDGLREGHGRVDVGAGDAAEHQDREHDAEAVAHGDVQPAGMVALGVFQFRVGDSAVAEDHQHGGADEFRGKLGEECVFHCSFLYCFFSNDSYDSCDSR